MCGLIYYHASGFPSVAKPVLKRYQQQKTRGSEGFGFISFSLDDRKLSYCTHQAEEKDIISNLVSIKAGGIGEMEGKKTNAILFHHRHPTSTPNFAECAHPIRVDNDLLDDVYFVIHNGIITNDDELKLKHEAQGFKYTTAVTKTESWKTASGIEYNEEKEEKYNDSEALAIEMAKYIDGYNRTMEAKGSIAVIVLRCSPDMVAKKLYYGRNTSNPLYLENNTKGFMCLKSAQGSGTEVKPHILYCYDYATGVTTEEPLVFSSGYLYDKNDYGYGRRGSASSTPSTPSTKTPLGFRLRGDVVEDDEDDKVLDTHHPAETVFEESHPHVMPLQDFTDYMNGPSQVHYNLDDLLNDNMSLDDLEGYVFDEMLAVEELVKWERYLGKRQHNVEQLEARLEDLEERLEEIHTLMATRDEEEADLYGVDVSELHDLRRGRAGGGELIG